MKFMIEIAAVRRQFEGSMVFTTTELGTEDCAMLVKHLLAEAIVAACFDLRGEFKEVEFEISQGLTHTRATVLIRDHLGGFELPLHIDFAAWFSKEAMKKVNPNSVLTVATVAEFMRTHVRARIEKYRALPPIGMTAH